MRACTHTYIKRHMYKYNTTKHHLQMSCLKNWLMPICLLHILCVHVFGDLCSAFKNSSNQVSERLFLLDGFCLNSVELKHRNYHTSPYFDNAPSKCLYAAAYFNGLCESISTCPTLPYKCRTLLLLEQLLFPAQHMWLLKKL